jgi:hypothetical protein
LKGIGMSYVGVYDDAGSKNAFYTVTKKIGRKRVGFKEFENKREAEFAHRIQKHLAQYNLAPMVYGDVGYIRKYSHDSDEFTAYGYLTEVARLMPQCYDDDCDGECFQTDCKNGLAIQYVVNTLDSLGLSYADGHRGNFGYVRRNGTWIPVVIDVGVEGFTDWDTSIYGDFVEESECDCLQCRKAREQYA